MPGAGFDPIEIIEQKVAAGEIDGREVERARAYWRRYLQESLMLPSGERVTISERSFHHFIDDNRIRRNPDRMVRLLGGIFEIQTAELQRRRALSRWMEGAKELVGYAILTAESEVWTLHVSREQEIRRWQRRGIAIWKR